MVKDNHTTQLGLWDAQPDNRPLPIILADNLKFRLAYIDKDGNPDNFLYHIQDWLRGLTEEDEIKQVWTHIRNRIKTSTVKESFTVEKAPYKATNGKTYQMEFTNDYGLYAITMRLNKSRPRVEDVLNQFASHVKFAEWVRRHPEAAIESLTARVKSTKARNLLTDTLKAHATDEINYGHITNLEYVGLFLMKAATICELTGASNARDGLTDLGLQFVTLCETYCSEHIRIRGHISFVEMCEVMSEVAGSLRISIAQMERRLGMSLATGKPLLKG